MGQSAEYAYAYFLDRGYPPQAAAAIVGNFDHESGFNTKAIHDEGTGFGIAGWRDEKPGKGRKTALMKFAQQNKLNPNSLGTQLQFADYELNTSEGQVGQRLKKATTVEEANDAMLDYERPQGWKKGKPQAGHGYSSRLKKAQATLASYAGEDAVANPDVEIVDNTDTEAIPTQDMGWDEDEVEAAAMEAEPAPTTGDRLKSGIKGLLTSFSNEDKQQEPFDYTPAGESNLDTDYNPQVGALPVDAYKQYANYAEGGNVDGGYIDPREYFAAILGEA